MNICEICGGEVQKKLDFGPQPICNRFLKNVEEKEFTHPLSIGSCSNCGLVQLTEYPPATEMQSPYSWVHYIEPEKHLDEIAEKISVLLKDNPNARICGVSYKDDSLLERLQKKGFQVYRLQPQDLGLNESQTGIELVQKAFNLEQARHIEFLHGKFDIVIARHILEHTHHSLEFFKAIKNLTKIDGLALFEVPDNTRNFVNLDYSCIWEEHLLYFTPETLQQGLIAQNFKLHSFYDFPYTLENCLVTLVKPHHESSEQKIDLSETINSANLFFDSFDERKKQIQSNLSLLNERGNIVVFGAGHTASLLINVMEIKDFIKCVIDDNQNKKDLFMPGSQLSIVGSQILSEDSISSCIFCLNPDVEDKIILLHPHYSGKFLSLSPSSKHSLWPDNKSIDCESNETREKNSSFKLEQDNLNCCCDAEQFIEKSKEVFFVKSNVVKLQRDNMEMLKQKTAENERKRCRICAHKNAQDVVHEMLITLANGTYIRPHRHKDKSESFHIIEGTAKIVLFDDLGNILDVIEMGDYSSGKTFFYRINDSTYHTVIITSPFLIFHETTKGPFDKGDTEFSSWSPDESSKKESLNFMWEVQKKLELFLESGEKK